ncbi:MAG: hypothetical protein BroJett030_16120 [Alphaproteobacteria bacterium]|nr:MAG: hypothetical protein BroJett030_16120 [Alphaproteobacteria bacterium]
MNDRFVLDSSALLAIVLCEPGRERALEMVVGSLVSAVNLSEAAAKLDERGFEAETTNALLGSLGCGITPFAEQDAYEAGRLRKATRPLGLSFGDRACLALAMQRRCTILTADRAWSRLQFDVEIEFIR